jgi:hypothetical protein
VKRGLSSQKRLQRLIESTDKQIPLTEKVPTRLIPSVNYGAIDFQSLKEEGRRILFKAFFKKEKAGYLDFLKKMIPILLNLHQSFWENQHFLRWQLMRLNTEYQTSVEKIWYEKWTGAGITERQQIEKYFFDFRDGIPRKIDTYQTWKFTAWIEEDNNGERRFGIKVAELMEKWKINFPPIPWVFRFIPRGYLDQLPLIPGYRNDRPPRGRPIEHWARNLLVYELSQAGMKNMETARLLFGVKKSTENWLKAPKHPVLVKIAKVKKAMEKLVSKSYLPSATVTKKLISKSNLPSADPWITQICEEIDKF